MPQLPRKDSDIFSEIRNRSKGSPLPPHVSKGIVESRRGKFVGSGAHQVVIADPEHPDQVIAFPYQEMRPEKAKELYYIQKLLSNLFPHNFVTVTAGIESGPDQKYISATVRGWVKNSVPLSDYGEFLSDAEQNLAAQMKISHPFSRALEDIKTLGLPITIDVTADNFVVTPEGDVVSLDNPTYSSQIRWAITAITSFMQKTGIDSSRQRRVLSAIDRLTELNVVKLDDKNRLFIRRLLQRD